ncbi:SCP-like protein [Cooperia oncophora]
MFMLSILLLSLCGLCTGYRENPDTNSCKDSGKYMDDTTRYKVLQFHDGTRTVLALGESPDNKGGFLPPAKNLFKMDSGKYMDDTTRYKVLQFHDGTRTVLALGESPDNKGGFLPPAKNLFKMRWNCALEEQARKLTENCPDKVTGVPEQGRNFYHGAVTDTRKGKFQFLSDAVDEWLAPTDTYALGADATFDDSNLYSFANMVYEKIYEIGCTFEQCGSGSAAKASLLCIYNTKVPLNTKLYEIGSTNQTIAGCAWDDKVCEHLQIKESAECDDLLCKLPYKVQNGFL